MISPGAGAIRCARGPRAEKPRRGPGAVSAHTGWRNASWRRQIAARGWQSAPTVLSARASVGHANVAIINAVRSISLLLSGGTFHPRRTTTMDVEEAAQYRAPAPAPPNFRLYICTCLQLHRRGGAGGNYRTRSGDVNALTSTSRRGWFAARPGKLVI
jgi:hypothetical protein